MAGIIVDPKAYIINLSIRDFLLTGVSYGLSMAGIGTAVRLFVQWNKDAKEKLELEKQNIKSELALLKNQVNPHFMFNTLNNIDSLIRKDPPAASASLNKLGDIMRYMAYDSEKERVPLQEEISYICDYIELQKIRIPNEDIIQFSVHGEVGETQIAPMLFIPFIENAFKHSSLKDDPGNKIDIRLDIMENHISFSCVNSIGKIVKDQTPGIGLENVQKRLGIIYKGNYCLTIEPSEKSFSVHLDIDL